MSKFTLNSNIEDVIIKYLEHCEIDKNLSQYSIKMYHFYLADFVDWAKTFLRAEVVTLKDITGELIKKYRINLNRRISSKSHLEYKRSSQKMFLISLRALLKYLVVEEELEVLPPEQIILGKTEDRIPKVLDEAQLALLFEVQNLNKRSGIRDRTILETFFSTGLRVSELISLNVHDINLDTGEFTVIGKGRKARTVYLSDNARRWIKRYLATRSDDFKPLFIRYSGIKMAPNDFDGKSLRLTQRSVQRLVKKYIARAGISVDATPHTLRHTFATGLLREGADLRSVQELLGHASVSTTQIYTHVTNKQLKDTHLKFHKDVTSSPSDENIGDDEKVKKNIRKNNLEKSLEKSSENFGGKTSEKKADNEKIESLGVLADQDLNDHEVSSLF